MKNNLILFMILLFIFLPGFADVGIFQLEKQPVMLSMVNSRARGGWTPVSLMIGTLKLRLWMDKSGQVWSRRQANRLHKSLFQIDQKSGGLLMNGQYIRSEIDSINDQCLRIRLLEDLPMVLHLDQEKGRVKLEIKGMQGMIPGFLLEDDGGQDVEIFFPGSDFSSGKKLVLLPGEDKIISLKNGPRIFARKDPWPKKTDE